MGVQRDFTLQSVSNHCVIFNIYTRVAITAKTSSLNLSDRYVFSNYFFCYAYYWHKWHKKMYEFMTFYECRTVHADSAL